MSDQTDDTPTTRQVYYKQTDDGLLVSANLAQGTPLPNGAEELTAEEYAGELDALAAAQADSIAAQKAALEGGSA